MTAEELAALTDGQLRVELRSRNVPPAAVEQMIANRADDAIEFFTIGQLASPAVALVEGLTSWEQVAVSIHRLGRTTNRIGGTL